MLLNCRKLHNKFLEADKIYHIIMNFLKRSYILVIELKKSIKRRELDMKYMVKDFEKDLLMDEIDFSDMNDSIELS